MAHSTTSSVRRARQTNDRHDSVPCDADRVTRNAAAAVMKLRFEVAVLRNKVALSEARSRVRSTTQSTTRSTMRSTTRRSEARASRLYEY